VTEHEANGAARYQRFVRSGGEGWSAKIQCQSVSPVVFRRDATAMRSFKINEMWTEGTMLTRCFLFKRSLMAPFGTWLVVSLGLLYGGANDGREVVS